MKVISIFFFVTDSHTKYAEAFPLPGKHFLPSLIFDSKGVEAQSSD
jgi:hypothetical protein